MKRFDRLEFDSPEPERNQTVPEHLTPDHDEHYWSQRADTERRRGLFENALRYYSRTLEINKAVIPAWLGQVQMLIALNEFSEAALWSGKALELFKNNGDLLAGQAHALTRLRDLKNALATSDVSLQREGQSAYRWMVRGEIMLAQNQDMDQHCFDKAIQADADWLVPLEIGQIIRYYHKPGRAMVRLRQAVERAPEHAYCWYALGCCEMEMNLRQAAKKSFIHSLELVPNYLEAQRKLTELTHTSWSLKIGLKRLFGRP